ncbi:hypothetical protein [Bacillus toyonensis]|uniref:hypothetical protein n=1 Tax=Bacillus toyonensis TaxID=155322 RepID=UPI000BF2EFDB|nr:hypothetical protein [Bacillus toyonensis]PGF05120.1 hypothetical protein COM61_01455 [Bacillus toyonensis]
MDELRASEKSRGAKYSNVAREKTVTLLFKDEPVTFLREEYNKKLTKFITRFEKHDGVKSIRCHFSKTSESIYVMVQYENRNGYLLFTIKNHKDYRVSSVKIFTTTKFFDMAHLGRAIGMYIQEAKESETLLFNFKFGTFLGLNTIYKLADKGYQITTHPLNYELDLSRGIYISSKVNISDSTLITDEVFLKRIKKLVHCGLIRAYKVNEGVVRFYISIFGSELYKQNAEKYKQQLSETNLAGIDGLLENSVGVSKRTSSTAKHHKKKPHTKGSYKGKQPYKKKPYQGKSDSTQKPSKPHYKKDDNTK